MAEDVIAALFNYLTPVTIVIALLAPSLWMSSAAGVIVAMVGVIAFSRGVPPSHVVASWLIAQVAVALVVNLLRRKAS